jgi:hypothetical protein
MPGFSFQRGQLSCCAREQDKLHMLFSTSIFIYAFLPVALAGYFLLARLRQGSLSRLWLAVASLFFYG